jgi:hypothetical protein
MLTCLLISGCRNLDGTLIDTASVISWMNQFRFCAKQQQGVIIRPDEERMGCGHPEKRTRTVIVFCSVFLCLLVVVLALRCSPCWKAVWPFSRCSSDRSGAGCWVEGPWPQFKLLILLLDMGSHIWVLIQVQ